MLHADITHTAYVFAARHAPYALSPDIESVLAGHYAEPHRAYHNAAHIAEVLRWFDVVGDAIGWQSPRDVYDAILFHDVIYDPTRSDNEAKSAELALQHGASERTAELVRLTAKHGSITEADSDAAHFLDADTAILGAAPAEFDAYDAAIAIEYKHVPPDAYRAGRRAFLEKMQARPRLFLTDFFHARLDAAARANLTRAISRLSP